MLNVLGTGCSRDYHPGPPSDFAQATVERLRSLLIDTTALIPASTLRIVDADGEIKAYWVLYIDIMCISLDGNVLDTAWAAVVAALHSTRLPSASWDPDREVVVSDPKPAAYRSLELRDMALTASFCVFTSTERYQTDTWILSDPDEFEESVCEERVLVCVRPDGKVARIEKSGGFGAGMEVISECVRRALKRFEFWEKLIKSN
jgi:exosome complex component RRP43